MSTWSIPPLVIASITLYAAMNHIFMYLSHRQRRVDLAFSVMCLFATAYDLLCVGLYSASSPLEGAGWQRGQVVAVAVFAAALVWFVSEFTDLVYRQVIIAIALVAGLVALIAAALPWEFVFRPEVAAIKTVELFGGATVHYQEAEAGPFVGVVYGLGFALFAYVLWLGVRFFRTGNPRKRWPLLLTLGFFLFALINDVAVSLGTYQSIYLVEYSYLFFVFLMAHSLSLEMLEASHARLALEQSEQQLQQAQKMEAIGRLAGGIAHDFNNLLVPILGYAELAQRRMEPADPAYEKLTRIREAADQAKSLTQQFLAFGRRQVLQMHIVNINDVLLNMKKLLRDLIEENISIEIQISSALGNVKADSIQLQQVVMNLAVNARDVMPDGGVLRIATRDVILGERTAVQLGIRPGRFAALSVTDSGTGMDKETMARVFEPFFTTKQAGQGTGLGLSMVYGIAKQHEGTVTVRSTLGEGSIFEVFLPVSDDDATPVRVERRRETNPDSKPATVLVVEDDPAVRALVAELLEDNGYNVISARDGVEGLRLAEEAEESIDLLLTDVVLPNLDGRELSRRLREERPRLKVLFMSGYTDDVMCAPLEEADDMPFLSKPFSTDTLVGRVRELLDRTPGDKE